MTDRLETIAIDGVTYTVSDLSPDDLAICQIIGVAIAKQSFLPVALALATAILVHRLVRPMHPELSVADIYPHVHDGMHAPLGNEIARQLMARSRYAVN